LRRRCWVGAAPSGPAPATPITLAPGAFTDLKPGYSPTGPGEGAASVAVIFEDATERLLALSGEGAE